MSAFIGPIHYWLYGKIRLVNQRQEYLREKVSEMCGSTAEELWEQVTQSYGEPLPEKDLGELIAHDNIHGWLQRQINLAESREAAFIKELTDTCGGAAEDLIGRTFVESSPCCTPYDSFEVLCFSNARIPFSIYIRDF